MKYRITGENDNNTVGWLLMNEELKTVRGDTGGTSSSYESRTVEELVTLARERGISLSQSDTKVDVIEKLREHY